MTWDIRREGRSWTGDEDQRLAMLGLLLENVGADAAVGLGNPAVWREAVARVP